MTSPLSPPELIPCPIHLNAVKHPDEIAIQCGDQRVTYRELDNEISAVAEKLREKGVKEGDIVALVLETSIEFVTLIFALFRIKGIAAPINTRFPDEAIADVVKSIHCSFIISDNRFQGSSPLSGSVIYSTEELIGEGETWYESDEMRMDVTQPSTVIFSSGSTGVPKAVLHAFGNHYYSAIGSNQNIAIQKGDRWLLSLPLYHVAGIAILFRTFTSGATVVIPDKKQSIESDLRIGGVTHASLVSTQLQQVVDDVARGNHFPKLKALLIGGSAVEESLRTDARAAQLPVCFSYGMSEMASQVTTTSPGASVEEMMSSGSLLPFRSLHIASGGEILVKGNTLFLGYLEGEQVSVPVDEEGWFHTGDLGRISDKGLLTVLGRKDNMFISGGENIYPEQIEKVIQLHPDVRQVMVVPVRDDKFGSRPVAFINGLELNPIDGVMATFLEGKLPRYMYPIEYFDWVEAPQRTGIKDNRREFAAKAEQLLNSRN